MAQTVLRFHSENKPYPILLLALGLLLVLTYTSCGGGGSGQTVLFADQNDGHDEVWEPRRFFGLSSWGIRGLGYPEGGEIWFNSFPWESGVYDVSLHAGLEQDGSAYYSLRAGERVLSTGRIPYLNGYLDCDAPGLAQIIPLGRHTFTQGERIALWAESTYECGDAGAYAIWESLVFTRIDEPE